MGAIRLVVSFLMISHDLECKIEIKFGQPENALYQNLALLER